MTGSETGAAEGGKAAKGAAAGAAEPAGAAGIANFRDLGGIPAAGGLHLRRGLVFRSAALDDLGPGQRAQLLALGIRLVVDLRAGAERTMKRALYEAPGVRIWHATGTSETGAPQHSVLAFLERPAGDSSVMDELYRSMPYLHADAFRALFLAIAEGELPMVFHCAAGKDRTGVAAALLLDLLGVARADILADYQESNAFLANTRAEFLINFPDRAAILAKEPQWAMMMRADPAFLESMFDEIGRRNGGTRGYLRHALQLPDSALRRIPQLLLA